MWTLEGPHCGDNCSYSFLLFVGGLASTRNPSTSHPLCLQCLHTSVPPISLLLGVLQTMSAQGVNPTSPQRYPGTFPAVLGTHLLSLVDWWPLQRLIIHSSYLHCPADHVSLHSPIQLVVKGRGWYSCSIRPTTPTVRWLPPYSGILKGDRLPPQPSVCCCLQMETFMSCAYFFTLPAWRTNYSDKNAVKETHPYYQEDREV